MAEYYSNSISRSRRRKRWSRSRKELFLLAIDIFMTILMALLVFCSISVVTCQYVSPEKSGILSIISLAAPIIYLLDLVVMFYWIMRWRMWIAVPMVILSLCGLFSFSLFYKLEVRRVYPGQKYERGALKVMTYRPRVGS